MRNCAFHQDILSPTSAARMGPRRDDARFAQIVLALLFATLVLGVVDTRADDLRQMPTVHAALSKIGFRIAKSSCKLIAPKIRVPASNPHDPDAKDELETRKCAGLEITYYKANSDFPPRLELTGLVLKQNHPLMPAALRIGASRQQVLEFNQVPLLALADVLIYRLNDEGPGDDSVAFHFLNDRLVSVAWTWHLE